MPGSRASLEATDAYREQLLRRRARIAGQTTTWWRSIVDVGDLDRSYQAWRTATARLLTAGQRDSWTLAETYLAAFLSSELGERVEPQSLEVHDVGRDRFGRTLERALRPPIQSVKVALGQGSSDEQSLQIGINRAVRTISGEYMWAARTALTAGMRADSRIIGWRRVTTGDACGACLGAATGAIRETDDILDAHTGCRCVAEPVIADVPERFHRPTGQEIFSAKSAAAQDALFAGRGGADKAQLIRDGMPLEQLVERQELALGGAVITEASLASLTP